MTTLSHAFHENGYAIAHNGIDIVQYISVTAGNTISTGQPYLEVFTSAAEAEARVEELRTNFDT